MDMGAIVSESQKASIVEYVESAKEEGAEVRTWVTHLNSELLARSKFNKALIYTNRKSVTVSQVFQIEGQAPEGCYYPPTLITNVNTASKVVMEEIFGPVLVAMPFR